MRFVASFAVLLALAGAPLAPANHALAAQGALPQNGANALAARLIPALANPGPRPKPEIVQIVLPEESRIEFHASSTFGKVTGVFHDWRAELKSPEEKFENASLKLEIEAASVKTGSGFRDREVKGKNFFAVKEYPEIRFVSGKILPDSDPTKFSMQGELTLRGITKPVTVAVIAGPVVKGHEQVEGSFTFNRREFGMTHNPPFNHVADAVNVHIALEVEEREAAF
jgi:polyisoprenoid-binding protein YceI